MDWLIECIFNMVNFNKKLENGRISKWAAFYIDYKGLQKIIDSVQKASKSSSQSHLSLSLSRQPSLESSPTSSLNTPLLPDEHSVHARSRFVSVFESELSKVSRFFEDRLVEYQERLALLQVQLEKALEITSRAELSMEDPMDEDDEHDPDIHDIKHATSSTDLSLLLPIDIKSSSSSSPSAAGPDSSSSSSSSSAAAAAPLRVRSIYSIKRAFIDLYRQLMFLQNFGILNATGFVKILKKHDKYTGASLSTTHLPMVDQAPFVQATRLQNLIASTERCFADQFCEGRIEVARAILLVKQGVTTDWAVFDLGLRLGVLILLLLWVVWDCIVDGRARPADNDQWIDAVLPVYRGVGCLVLLGWLWGVNLYVWQKHRVNYLYIFELDPRATMTYKEVFQKCTTSSILFLGNFLVFYKVLRKDFPGWIPALYYPMMLYIWMLFELFFLMRPARCRGGVRRNPWLHILLQVLISPFGSVSFLTAYLGDVLTSLVRVLNDLAFGICFITAGDFLGNTEHLRETSVCFNSQRYKDTVVPLLSALPLWFRFNQCLRRYRDSHQRWPHLGNAFKYALAQTVVLFGIFNGNFAESGGSVYRGIWITSLVCSTLYTFWWDVVMDWGLGHWHQVPYKLLRKRLMFPHPAIYYAAIVIDLFLRFTWTLTLVPQGPGSVLPQTFFRVYLTPFLASGELLRRCMWGFLRVEHEHLTNTEGYRRVDFIPLHFDTPALGPAKPELAKKKGWMVALEVAGFTGVLLGIALAAKLTSDWI